MILLYTSNNTASKNIADMLIENHSFRKKSNMEWECGGIRLVETNAPTVLDVPTDFDSDLLVVLSTHKSKAGGKMLTAHFPGNWGDAKFGGRPKTLNMAFCSRLKTMIKELDKANTQKWPLFMEADHHGPTCDVPIIFVEIGSTEEQWNDLKAAESVASAVSEFMDKEEEYESVVGFGGGHYSREFTKLLLEGDLAVGHVAPKYVIDSLDEEMFMQAVEKNVEKISKAVILKKETNSSQKKKIVGFAEKAGLEYQLI
jgi:D-aminoacyl-tRNA deacylase